MAGKVARTLFTIKNARRKHCRIASSLNLQAEYQYSLGWSACTGSVVKLLANFAQMLAIQRCMIHTYIHAAHMLLFSSYHSSPLASPTLLYCLSLGAPSTFRRNNSFHYHFRAPLRLPDGSLHHA